MDINHVPLRHVVVRRNDRTRVYGTELGFCLRTTQSLVSNGEPGEL